MTERDNPHTDLGYLSPDEGEDAYVARLDRQMIDAVTDAKKRKTNRPRRHYARVRDFESDLDHKKEMEAIPAGFIDDPDDEEPYPDFPAGMGREVARAIAQRAFKQGILKDTEGDEARRRVRLRVYDDTHPNISA